MPGKFWSFGLKTGEKRPIGERGFTELEPNSTYANIATCDFRKVDIKADGEDPLQTYPPGRKVDEIPAVSDDAKARH